MLSYTQNIETKPSLSEQAFFTTKQASFPAVVSTNPEAISRLISAAVVDKSFRKLLLSKPQDAMSLGYNGETFDLTEEDQSLILTIQAASLTDFAAQLIRLRENNCTGEWIVRKPVKVDQSIQKPLETKPDWKLQPLSTR